MPKTRKRHPGNLGIGRITAVRGGTWDQNLNLLKEFRKTHKGKWPARDSGDPTEAWLAVWFRHSLAAHHSYRLEPGQSRRLEAFLTGKPNDRKRKRAS